MAEKVKPPRRAKALRVSEVVRERSTNNPKLTYHRPADQALVAYQVDKHLIATPIFRRCAHA